MMGSSKGIMGSTLENVLQEKFNLNLTLLA